MVTRAIDKKHFKATSPPEPLDQIQIISQKSSSYCNLPKLPKGSALPNKTAARALDKNYFKTTSADALVQIQNNFKEMFLIMSYAKIV